MANNIFAIEKKAAVILSAFKTAIKRHKKKHRVVFSSHLTHAKKWTRSF